MIDSYPQIRRKGTLEVYALGVLDYTAYLKLQDRLVFDLSGRDDEQTVLILCEFAPTISMGRNALPEQLLKNRVELKHLGLELNVVSRGGTCIPHLPGQLAVSLLSPLEKIGFNPVSLQQTLMETAILAAQEFKVSAEADHQQGVIISSGAVVGYSGSRTRFGISAFGVYLNINPWLEFFRLVKLPGEYQRVTSFNRELMKHIESAKVREYLIQHLAQKLGYDKIHIYTRHPLFERTSRKLVVHVPY
jgi:lipoyl(octanoyl) transferase